VIDTVLTTDLFRVIQGYGTVTICDYEDVFRWKYLLRSYERRSNDGGGFVLLEVSASFTCGLLALDRGWWHQRSARTHGISKAVSLASAACPASARSCLSGMGGSFSKRMKSGA
jgi:hypothetical protein